MMIQWAWRFRIDDTLEEYVAEVRRHPLVELRPMITVTGSGEADDKNDA
jgi:hypothetical protein